MANVLKLKNITYKLELVPSAGHGFDFDPTPQQWQQYILPAFDFAQQFLTSKETEQIDI